jgi:hypothetical protein
MSHARSRSHGPRAYRRYAPRFVSSGKVVLIITEGEKTEPNYLKALRDRFNLAAKVIEIVHPEGTDPLTLTRKAVELRDQRKKTAKKGYSVEYDEVWVLFDLEKPNDERRRLAKEAMSLPVAKGLKFALSDPCFEYWLLLHDEYTTALFSDCDSVIKRLKPHLPNYTKGQKISPEFLAKVPVAVKHAMRCRIYHRTATTSGNPSTDVDLIVRSMNGATRPHLQFELPAEKQ